jgi:hypothetical protein
MKHVGVSSLRILLPRFGFRAAFAALLPVRCYEGVSPLGFGGQPLNV